MGGTKRHTDFGFVADVVVDETVITIGHAIRMNCVRASILSDPIIHRETLSEKDLRVHSSTNIRPLDILTRPILCSSAQVHSLSPEFAGDHPHQQHQH